MWECPYVDCMSSVFGVRAGFGMDTSLVFLQVVLAVIPLMGGGGW